jgi:hypothetical protein
MPPVFRQTPPSELLDLLCKCFYLRSKDDPTPFTKTSINLDAIDELLPELEPYYVPCKAQIYLFEPLTFTRALVILRQVLKSHGLLLKSFEKTQGNEKVTWYQIKLATTTSLPVKEENFTISFE